MKLKSALWLLGQIRSSNAIDTSTHILKTHSYFISCPSVLSKASPPF
uniref:Uncharacterized protein n=1 Tax=Anguilla anguilla TaxID=7936 RepID=A0A0E9UGM7_ANGAN